MDYKEMLDEMLGVDTEVVLVGQDDQVTVQMMVEEFPPVYLMVRPIDVTIDGQRVSHSEFFDEAQGDIRVEEGQSNVIQGFLDDYLVQSNGPGPDVVSLAFAAE